MPHVFEKGSYLPLPSQEAMANSIGTGGNGVITNIYHKRMEFAVKRVSLYKNLLGNEGYYRRTYSYIAM